jgi:hypothetical protein
MKCQEKLVSKQLLKTRPFTKGSARNRDLLHIISVNKSMTEEEIPHASIIAVFKEKWSDCFNTNWNSTAISIARRPDEKVVVVGEDGEVSTYAGGVSKVEKKLKKVSMIRNSNTIDGYVYACGMKRQVYKRTSENQWIDISAPFHNKKEKAGFESIDGFSEDEIYAVGWNGEIWRYNGKKWLNYSTLTNLILTSVFCASNGLVYIVGQHGLLISGRHDKWEIIEWDDEVDIDFWDVCYFKNKLYIASIPDLYTYENDELISVDFKNVSASSFFCLTQSEGVLWSIGAEDVLSFDGKKWKKYN